MKYISFFITTVLLFNSFLNDEVLANGSSGVSQQEAPNKRETRLIDLYPDALYNILEVLSLDSLVNMAEALPGIQAQATCLINKKYYDIKFINGFSNAVPYAKYKVIGNYIEIYNLELFLNLIEKFGSVIKHVDNRIGSTNANYSTILGHINKYGSESLKKLAFASIATLEPFVFPFKCVEYLEFTVVTEIQAGSLPFDQIFPQLRRLKLEMNFNTDINVLDVEFKHLDHIHLVIDKDAWQQKDKLEQFLRKNSQIRSIEIRFNGPNDEMFDLKNINEMLPNILNLTLHTFYLGNEPVHFNKVKNFVLYSSSPNLIQDLSFENLESLKMVYSFSEHYIPWRQFFGSHSNLTHLQMKTSTGDGLINLVNPLLQNLPHLRQLKLECDGHFFVQLISEIIENHGEMEKFEFYTNRPSDEGMDDLREHFQNEWIVSNIEHFHSKGLSFVRERAR